MAARRPRVPATVRRVPRQTEEEINRRIEAQIARNILYFAGHPAEIPSRLKELDHEWDIERTLEANAASFAFAGTVLGIARSRSFLMLPALVTVFLLQHAVQGWCPPLPILRRLGFRTSREIDRERNALKALRGDFSSVSKRGDTVDRAQEALDAATMGSAA
jgi:hypothetical protein